MKWGDSTAQFDWEIALRYVDKDTNGIFASQVCRSFFFFFQNKLKKKSFHSDCILVKFLNSYLAAPGLNCSMQDLRSTL